MNICGSVVLTAFSCLTAGCALHAAPAGMPPAAAEGRVGDLAFVVPPSGGGLEAYELPRRQRIPLAGHIELRRPTALAVTADAAGNPVLFIVDNMPHQPRWFDRGDVYAGPRVVRVSLGRHESARRRTLVVRDVRYIGARTIREAGEQPIFDAIEVVDSELRVAVIDRGRRSTEYFTLDGLLLERSAAAPAP